MFSPVSILKDNLHLLESAAFYGYRDIKMDHSHCVKSMRTRSFSGPYIPTFGLNTEC